MNARRKDTRVSIAASERDVELITDAARRKGISVSEFIREAALARARNITEKDLKDGIFDIARDGQ